MKKLAWTPTKMRMKRETSIETGGVNQIELVE